MSATGSWECKLEGKVTWGLVMGSLFHTVSEHDLLLSARKVTLGANVGATLKLTEPSSGENVKLELSCVAGRNAIWYNQFGKQFLI